MKQWRFFVGILGLIWGGIALQQTGQGVVQIMQNPTLGAYLTDDQGKSLYLYTQDTKATSNCYDQCAQNWPPMLVPEKATAGKGVAAALLGTTKRKDGKLQVTYSGMPLYYFAKDAKSGDIAGQAVGGVWFLVSPYGAAIKPAQATTETPKATPAEPMAAAGQKPELMKQGEIVFGQNCVFCHGSKGEGGSGPALAGNAKLAETDVITKQILFGGHFMPPFKDQLLDKEVAAVATFVRNSWGNNFGVTLEDMVKKYR